MASFAQYHSRAPQNEYSSRHKDYQKYNPKPTFQFNRYNYAANDDERRYIKDDIDGIQTGNAGNMHSYQDQKTYGYFTHKDIQTKGNNQIKQQQREKRVMPVSQSPQLHRRGNPRDVESQSYSEGTHKYKGRDNRIGKMDKKPVLAPIDNRGHQRSTGYDTHRDNPFKTPGQHKDNDLRSPRDIPSGLKTDRNNPNTLHNSTSAIPSPKDGLSTATKMDVLSRNRQLIYMETQWTRKRLEKLRACGFGDAVKSKRLRTTKEDRRWDLIMRYVHEDTKTVHIVWEFLKTDFTDVFPALHREYTSIIRNHFKPRIANLQTTPSNAHKMIEILMEQTEEYDQRMMDMERYLTEREEVMQQAKKVLEEAREVVYTWGGRDIPDPEPDEDIMQVSEQVRDTVIEVSHEKDQQLEKEKAANEELKKKMGRLNKALKDKNPK